MNNTKLAEYLKENTLNNTLVWNITRKTSYYPVFKTKLDAHVFETSVDIADVPVTFEVSMAKVNKNRTEYNIILRSTAGPLTFVRGQLAEDVYNNIRDYLGKQREELKQKIESIF